MTRRGLSHARMLTCPHRQTATRSGFRVRVTTLEYRRQGGTCGLCQTRWGKTQNQILRPSTEPFTTTTTTTTKLSKLMQAFTNWWAPACIGCSCHGLRRWFSSLSFVSPTFFFNCTGVYTFICTCRHSDTRTNAHGSFRTHRRLRHPRHLYAHNERI